MKTRQLLSIVLLLQMLVVSQVFGQDPHDVYLSDFMQGKTVTIKENIDCHFYRDWGVPWVNVNMKLIGDKPFTVYWKINRGPIRTEDPGTPAQREEFVKDGVKYYAYTWAKKDDTLTWCEGGISVRDMPVNMILVKDNSVGMINISFPFPK